MTVFKYDGWMMVFTNNPAKLVLIDSTGTVEITQNSKGEIVKKADENFCHWKEANAACYERLFKK